MGYPYYFLVASAVSTASSPQHIFACLRRFPVEFASPLSRKRRTSQPFLPLHRLASHSKMWHARPSLYSIRGVGLKKTYIGDVHFCDNCSTLQCPTYSCGLLQTPARLI